MEKRLVVCDVFVRSFVIFTIFRRNPYVFFRHHLQSILSAIFAPKVAILSAILDFGRATLDCEEQHMGSG